MFIERLFMIKATTNWQGNASGFNKTSLVCRHHFEFPETFNDFAESIITQAHCSWVGSG